MSAKAGSPTHLELEAIVCRIALAGQLQALGDEHLQHLNMDRGRPCSSRSMHGASCPVLLQAGRHAAAQDKHRAGQYSSRAQGDTLPCVPASCGTAAGRRPPWPCVGTQQ